LRAASLHVIRWDGNNATLVAPPGAIVSRDGDPVTSPARAILLAPSQLIEATFGDFVLSARLAPVERIAGLHRPAPRGLGSLAVSAAAHVVCLALALAVASRSRNGDELSLSQLRIMRHLLEASEARDTLTSDVPSRHDGVLRSEPARTSARSPPTPTAAVLPGVPLTAPTATTESEPTPSAEGDGVNVKDVGGLLASLERRLSVPLQGGFANLPDREARPWANHPEESLHPPYRIISDGRIDRDVIRRVVGASSKNLLSCLEGVPRAKGSAAGHVAVTFTVGSFGQVVAAHDVGGDAPVDVRACIVRGFYALRFPAPERGTATVTYPLLLAPEE
jgi:hypothetical protein